MTAQQGDCCFVFVSALLDVESVSDCMVRRPSMQLSHPCLLGKHPPYSDALADSFEHLQLEHHMETWAEGRGRDDACLLIEPMASTLERLT